MKVACELDMVQVLGVYHKTQARFYTPEKAQASARWIANRYRDVPQIIWSMYPEARNGYIPVVEAIVRGLQEGDGGAHMVSVHPDPSPQSSSFLHDEPWLAFNMLQTCIEIELVHPMTAADYGMHPDQARDHGRGRVRRRRVQPADLPPGYPQAGLLDVTWRAGTTSTGTTITTASWTVGAIGSIRPGSCQLGVFRRIVTSLKAWWDIVPDQSIIASGAGNGTDLAAAAKSRVGDWACVYFASPGARMIRMDRIRTADRVIASWVNPITGGRARIGEYPYSKPVTFSTPQGWDDALLLLEG